MERIIGIDFGTSTTVVTIYNQGDNRIVTLKVENGIEEIPTLLFKRSDGTFECGGAAYIAIKNDTNGEIIKNFKLQLISADEEEKSKAIEYTKLFFKYLHDKYVERCNAGDFGNPPTNTKIYVSYPAKWPSHIRQIMKQCAIDAGFGDTANVFGLDEPTAAVVASLHENENELRNAGLFYKDTTYRAMMIDMGAGTTDIVLLEYRIENGKVNITNPVTYPTADSKKLCGGQEIDKILSQHLKQYCETLSANGMVSNNVMDVVGAGVKEWKEQQVSYSYKNNQSPNLPATIVSYKNTLKGVGLLNPNAQPFDLSRTVFAQLTRLHWLTWRSMIEEALKEGEKYGYTFDNINMIILTGGHSQWYNVKDFLLGKDFADIQGLDFPLVRKYPQSLIQSKLPSQAVARGLCMRSNAIVAATPLSNHLWLQFRYEGKESKLIEVAQKGCILPTIINIQTIEDTITGDFIARKEFVIETIVYEGSSIENATITTRVVKSNSNSFFNSLFKTILLGTFGPIALIVQIIRDFLNNKIDWSKYGQILTDQYKIKIDASIQIAEDGIATIAPKIIVDNELVPMDPFSI